MKIKLVILCLLGSSLAYAQSSEILFSRTVTLPVDISKTKVVKTNLGYGQTFLVKILVPELAAETLMNHRNESEDAPCLATYEAQTVGQIIQNKPAVDQALFKIELSKSFNPDPEKNICHLTLIESVSTQVRGFLFIHVRESQLPDRVLADCK